MALWLCCALVSLPVRARNADVTGTQALQPPLVEPSPTVSPCKGLTILALWALPDEDPSPGTQVQAPQQGASAQEVWLAVGGGEVLSAGGAVTAAGGGPQDLGLSAVDDPGTVASALDRAVGTGALDGATREAVLAAVASGAGRVFVAGWSLNAAWPAGDTTVRVWVEPEAGCPPVEGSLGIAVLAAPTPTPSPTPTPTPAPTATPTPTPTATPTLTPCRRPHPPSRPLPPPHR